MRFRFNTGVLISSGAVLMPGQKWVPSVCGSLVKVIPFDVKGDVPVNYKPYMACDYDNLTPIGKENDSFIVREIIEGSLKSKYAYFVKE